MKSSFAFDRAISMIRAHEYFSVDEYYKLCGASTTAPRRPIILQDKYSVRNTGAVWVWELGLSLANEDCLGVGTWPITGP